MSKKERVVVGESGITAGQMKDFWRKVGDGTIGFENFNRFLENPGKYFQLVPDIVVVAKRQLQAYFQEVFNLKLNLSKIKFPKKEGFNIWMVVPPQLDEDAIMNAFVKKWGVKIYRYLSPVAEKINRDKEQKRPTGLYVFAHRDGDESDEKHHGKSYNQAMGENLIFANAKEYLLITGFHKFTKNYFMDKKSWTRTSSLWSDGFLVSGGWDGVGDWLDLDCGYPDYGYPGDGPRELFLG